MAFRGYPRKKILSMRVAALPIALLLLLGMTSCANRARRRRVEWGKTIGGIRIEIVGVPESSTTAGPVEIRFRAINSGKRAIRFDQRSVLWRHRSGWLQGSGSGPLPRLVHPNGSWMRPKLIPPYDAGRSVELKPGQTHSDVIDVTQMYILTDPGRYEVYMELRPHVRSFWSEKVKPGPLVASRRHTLELAQAPVGRCLEHLRDPKWQIRYPAAIRLGKARSPEAVPALILALGDEHARVRGSAAEALGRIGTEEAVATLMHSLTGTPYDVQRGAARGLGHARDPVAVPRLMEVLATSEGRGLRWYIIRALGEIGDRRATTMLLEEFEDPDSDVRRWAVDALGAIKDERAVGPLLREVETIRERKYRRHDNASFEYVVMRALANTGAPEAIDPIIALLGHAHAYVRKGAARALGLLDGERVLAALIVALNNGDSRVRQAAARSLGDLGDPRAVRPLVRTMNDRFGSVRAAVVTALGKIGGAKVKQVVGAALDDRNFDVRYAAETALKHINTEPTDRQTLPEFPHSLRRGRWPRRRSATHPIGRAGLPLPLSGPLRCRWTRRYRCPGRTTARSRRRRGSAVSSARRTWRTALSSPPTLDGRGCCSATGKPSARLAYRARRAAAASHRGHRAVVVPVRPRPQSPEA